MLKYLYLIIGVLCLPIYAAAYDTDFATADRYELKGGHTLLYDQSYAALAMQYQDGELSVIADFCSYPAVTPDKSTFTYLEPWGFEEISTLYLYDVAQRKAQAVKIPDIQDEYPEQDTAKEIMWLDDRLLLIIAGYGNGTVTMGGDLYYYDNTSGKSGRIITCCRMEIAAIERTTDNITLTLYGPLYQYQVGRYLNELRDSYTQSITIAELRQLIENGTTMTLTEAPEKVVLYRAHKLAGWLYGKMLEQHGFDPVAIMLKRN